LTEVNAPRAPRGFKGGRAHYAYMTEEQKQQSIERLRKLYAFAISKNNTKWAERIKSDAERIKNAPNDDLYEAALKLFQP